jgi:hypothetical protein
MQTGMIHYFCFHLTARHKKNLFFPHLAAFFNSFPIYCYSISLLIIQYRKTVFINPQKIYFYYPLLYTCLIDKQLENY